MVDYSRSLGGLGQKNGYKLVKLKCGDPMPE